MRTKNTIQWILPFVLIASLAACAPVASEPADNPPAVAESESISVKLILDTGSDGTADNPVFGLFDASGSILFTTTLDNPGDLQPGQTDTYEFTVPYPFCQFIGWQLTKPSTGGIDDAWLSTRISIEIDGGTVWLDGAFNDLGTITADSQRGGNWSGTEIYMGQCIN
jgi:hypothetical protein